MSDLYLLAINLTQRCNLACAHCYMDAQTLQHGGPDELTTAEVSALLDQIAGRSPETMVVLTGGEPLLRHDLETLVAHGTARGLSMVVGSNGVMLTEPRVQALKAAGAMGVGISVDSLDPARHDAFRGRPGSWERTLAGIDNCRRHDLPFQVHFSVTEANASEVPAMIAFARASGAKVLNVFFLVCTGRGESMTDISPATYERVLQELVEAQERSTDLIIRARCAPHFKRIAYQRDPASKLTRAEGYEGGGCLAGIHYCRITPEGGVTACPYIPEGEGDAQGCASAAGGRMPGAANIRQTPFWEIWDNAPTFERLRNPKLNGKCGQCEFQMLCIGCRARPLAMGGTLMDADPWCGYQPQGGAVIQPLAERPSQVGWTSEAEQRLARVPGFLRKMVKKRAETHTEELGAPAVTVEHLATLSARRFGGGPPRPDFGDLAPTPPPKRGGKLPWSEEAWDRLRTVPAFLRDGMLQVAVELAQAEGRLEVNVKLLDRLEAEDEPARGLPWSDAAEARLRKVLAEKPPQVRMFIGPALEGAAERAARRRRADRVECEDVDEALKPLSGGVQWEPDALARVRSAPDFVRAGIKKAAEFNARREGLGRITSEDLTRFRNRAMMRAVRRMKHFGMTELSFDAYDIARERVPRLQDNDEADKRFAAIRDYVESKQTPDGSGLGLLDRELLEKMKAELKKQEI